jgi:preprotein translocase subunit SecA
MMDRIEDETVRYLFFLQVSTSSGPILPFPEEGEEESDGSGNGGPSAAAQAVEEERRRAAKAQMEDFTRNIERKKDKELAALQLGGDDSSGPRTVAVGQKVGRNDPCPCGSGKKYKKCHGAG